jgi:hypothetical protein
VQYQNLRRKWNTCCVLVSDQNILCFRGLVASISEPRVTSYPRKSVVFVYQLRETTWIFVSKDPICVVHHSRLFSVVRGICVTTFVFDDLFDVRHDLVEFSMVFFSVTFLLRFCVFFSFVSAAFNMVCEMREQCHYFRERNRAQYDHSVRVFIFGATFVLCFCDFSSSMTSS